MESSVSVRLPSSLLNELRTIAKQEHYLDLSECVRSIVRTKALEQSDPYLSELKSARKELSQKLQTKQDIVKKMKQEKVRAELKKILTEMEGL